VIDRDVFFGRVRVAPFGGTLTQGQVDGCNAILDAWESRDDMTDPRWLAYMLATAKWETAHTMKPIEEYGHGVGREYGSPDPETGKTYYGRGLVQLTWKANYAKMSAVTGVDLVYHPELALDPKVASIIMFEGMKGGMFTGVGLPRYFSASTDDPVSARRIINGIDHAGDIAVIHRGFLAALKGDDNA
jgi:putative chitinase